MDSRGDTWLAIAPETLDGYDWPAGLGEGLRRRLLLGFSARAVRPPADLLFDFELTESVSR